MQGGRRVFLFDGAADVADVADACAGEGLQRLTQSSDSLGLKSNESAGPTRAPPSLKAKRRSFISFANRTVDINSSRLSRSSSMACMSPTKRSEPPPELTRGESVTMNTSRSFPKDLGSTERDEIVREPEEFQRRVSTDDPLMKEAMDSVQLRKRGRPRKVRQVVVEEFALRDPSPLSPDDDWNDDDIPTDNTDNANIVGNYVSPLPPSNWE